MCRGNQKREDKQLSHFRWWIVGILLLCMNPGYTQTDTFFRTDNLDEALIYAALSGAPVMAYFFSSQENRENRLHIDVNASGEFQSWANTRFITVRINVDNFDGFAWQQEWQIEEIPYVIIIGPARNLIFSTNEVRDLQELISRIATFPEIQTGQEWEIVHPVNTSPSQIGMLPVKRRINTVRTF